jgi:arylsulfatase A-like enzyme
VKTKLLLLVALVLGAFAEGCSDDGSLAEDGIAQTDSVELALDAASAEDNSLALVATSVAANKSGTTTAVVNVPAGVGPNDLAVAVVLTTGSVSLASSPPGFVTTNLAASNHRLSYGKVGSATSLTWTTSASATTGATAYFFRGEQITVATVKSASTTSATFGLTAAAPSVGAPSFGFALFGLQISLSSPATIASGPGGSWLGPDTDGRQLYTWSQSLGRSDSGTFAFPTSAGTLSTSATFRSADILVTAPVHVASGSAPSSKPNILLVIADDLGAEAVSLYPALTGNSGAVSIPNIEALAANGLVFDNAWASPVCSPTRGTIVSGLYGHRTGVTYVGNVLPTSTTTLFDRIRAESPSYDTAVLGKYHLGTTTQHVRDLGIPKFRGFLGSGIDDYFNFTAVDINGPSVNYKTYAATVLTDFAIDHITQHRTTRPNDPWFVYQAYNSPHFPNQVPPANLHSVPLGSLQPGQVSNTVPNYKAMIQSLDTELGRLLAQVDLATTTVIFIGDNGTPSNVKDQGAKIRGSKSSVYEGGVRVPLIVAGAGVTRRGHEGALVSSTDLYATILSLTGIPVGHVNNSYNFAPLFSSATASSGRTHSFTEMCNGGSRLYAIRDRRYKLLNNSGQWALYDLETDPLETTNLFTSTNHASVRAGLEAEIAALKAQATAGCFS